MRSVVRSTVVMLGLSAVLGSVAVSGQPAQKGKYSGTYEANCFVKVTWDAHVLPLEPYTVEELVHSSGVAGDAVWSVFGKRFYDFRQGVDEGGIWIGFESAGSDMPDGTMLAKLMVELSPDEEEDLQPAAKELVTAICARLRDVLSDAHQQELQRMHQQLDLSALELQRADAVLIELQELRAALCRRAGRSDLSREEIVEEMQDLRNGGVELEMDLAAQQARLEALKKHIAAIGQELEQRTQHDPVLTELEKIVALRGQEVQRMKSLVDAAVASDNEVRAVEEDLAMAKVELARYQMEAAERVGAGRLSHLNEELSMLSIEAVEAEARHRFVAERLKTFEAGGLLELADRYEREVDVRLPLAVEAVERAAVEHAELEAHLRTTRLPAVTVLGAGKAGETPKH